MKKSFKTTLSVVLALVMILSAVPMIAMNAIALTADEYIDGEFVADGREEVAADAETMFIIEKISSRKKEISIVGVISNATTVTIPQSLKGYTVTEIGANAFDGRTDDSITAVKTVNIAPTIKKINTKAFNSCPNLEQVNFLEFDDVEYPYSEPDISEICADAFFNCAKLYGISIPRGVVKIGERAFGYTFFNSEDGYKKTVVPNTVPGYEKGFVVSCYTNTAAFKYAQEEKNSFSYVNLYGEQTITPVTGFWISPKVSDKLEGGEVLQLTKYFTGNENPTNTFIRWFSSDEYVATVNKYGLVTGQHIGTTTITAISSDNLHVAESTITVISDNPDADDGEDNPNANVAFTGSLATGNVTAYVTNPPTRYEITYNTVPAGEDVTFTYDKTYFTITKDAATSKYYLNPVKATTTPVVLKIALASDTTQYDTCNVTISGSVIAVTDVDWTFAYKPFQSKYSDGTIAAEYLITPTNATNKKVVLYSSNENVAYWRDGVLVPYMNGWTDLTIKTEDGGYTDTVRCYIYGSPYGDAVLGISFAATTAKVSYAGTVTLKPVFTPATAKNQQVTWKSSNTDVATVSDAGVVTVRAGSGSSIITATSKENTNISATCTVTAYYTWWQWLLKVFTFGFFG